MADIQERTAFFRRLLIGIQAEFSMPPKEDVAEAEMKKWDVDLGLICGVLALVLTVAAICGFRTMPISVPG